MLEKKHSIILFSSSFFILKLSILLYSMGFKYISFMYFILFLTSINHWKTPKYDNKRKADMIMVFITTTTSVVYSWLYNKYSLEYNITVLYSFILYLISNIFYTHGYFLASTLIHSKIHLICLVGNYKTYNLISKLNFQEY